MLTRPLLCVLLGGVSLASAARLGPGYGELPVSFEANQGQAEPSSRFLSHGRHVTVSLTDTGAAWASASGVMRMRFAGANRAVIEGLDPLPGRSHFLLGSDPGQWRTGVAHYARVRYRDVYPGIDVVFYGKGRQLEYDFVVAPGADPALIRLAFSGAGEIRVDAGGDLVLRTAAGELRQHRPVMHQKPARVSGRYVLLGSNQAGFRVGRYDRLKPLVIDPLLSYSTFLGGGDTDNAGAVAADRAGNAYVTGCTTWTGLAVTPGAPQTAHRGGCEVFVVKLNPAGTGIVYATYLGGSGNDVGTGIAVDAAGNAYVTGRTASNNFPVTPGVFQSTYRGGGAFGGDVFVAKLNPAGTALLYSTYLGGSGEDMANGIAVDAAGNASIAGSTSSSNFPTLQAIQGTFRGGPGSANSDAFAARLNPSGTGLVFSTFLGGTAHDVAWAVAVDSSGNTYVAGETGSSAFPTTPGAFQTSLQGFSDGFVVKIGPTGSGPVYSTFLGGAQASNRAYGLAVDASGHAFVTGQCGSRFPTTPGALLTTFPPEGSSVAFVSRLNPAGNALVYSTFLGGNRTTVGRAIAVDAGGAAFLTGETDSSTFPATIPLQPALAGTLNDAFVAKLNPEGSALLFASHLGGREGSDYGQGIAVDPSGNAYVVGRAGARDFPTASPLQAVHGGRDDAFIAKIDFTIRPRLSNQAAVNAASYLTGPVAPGEIISIFGEDLGPVAGVGAQLDTAGRVATLIGGTRVMFDGRPAPLFFSRYDQVNVQVPYQVAGRQTTQVQVSHQGALSNAITVPVATSAPGIFTLAGGRDAVVVNQDTSINARSAPAAPGSVIILFATGEGQTDPGGVDGKLSEAPFPAPVLPVSLTIGGSPANILFAGAAPGFAGLLQINARVSPTASVGAAVPVSLRIGDVESQPGVTLAVGERFAISNLIAGPSTNSGTGATLPLVVDFEDLSGSATSGSIRVNFDIAEGSVTGFATMSPQGVTAGQTSGTMRLTLSFFGFRFVTGRNLPIVISLRNGLGLESNQATGVFETR